MLFISRASKRYQHIIQCSHHDSDFWSSNSLWCCSSISETYKGHRASQHTLPICLFTYLFTYLYF